jgi:hypothetical protein
MMFIKATSYETDEEMVINVEDISVMQRMQDHTKVWLISDTEIEIVVNELPSAMLESAMFIDTEGL